MDTWFDELQLELGRLPPLHWVAFCGAVSESLLPNYAAFIATGGDGDLSLLRKCLDLVWKGLAGEPVSDAEWTMLVRDCEEIAPYPEEFDSDFASAALDAVNAVTATLLCYRDRDLARCIEVASYARDTVDMFLQIRDVVDSSALDFETQIAGHPMMYREIDRQRALITMLADAPDFDEPLIARLRTQPGSLSSYY